MELLIYRLRGRRRRCPRSLYDDFANNNERVPSSCTRSIHQTKAGPLCLIVIFFHAHNTPSAGSRSAIVTVKSFTIDASRSRWVVLTVRRDREIKSNATATPVTIDEWHLDGPGYCASACRIRLLVYRIPSWL